MQIKRIIWKLSALLAIALLAGCGRSAVSGGISSGTGNGPAAAGLPSLADLDGMAGPSASPDLRHVSSGGQTITWPLIPLPLAISTNSTPIANGYQLESQPGGMDWMVVRSDEFTMKVNFWQIRPHTISGDAFYAFADFKAGCWNFFRSDPATEDFSGWPKLMGDNPDYKSPAGYRYWAIVVANGSAAETGAVGINITTGQPFNTTIRELSTYSDTKLVEYKGYPAIIFNDATDGKLKVAYTHNDFPFLPADWKESTISAIPDDQCYLDAVAQGDKLYVAYIAANNGELHIAWTQGGLSAATQWTDVLSHTGNVGLGETLEFPRLAASADRLYLTYTNWDPQDLNGDSSTYQIAFSNLGSGLLANPYLVTGGTSLQAPRAALAVVAGRPAFVLGDSAGAGLEYYNTLSTQPVNTGAWGFSLISSEQFLPDHAFLFDRHGKPVVFAEQVAETNVFTAYSNTSTPQAADWLGSTQQAIGGAGTLEATLCGEYGFWMLLHEIKPGQHEYYEYRGMRPDFDPDQFPYSRQLADIDQGTYGAASCAVVKGQPSTSWVKYPDGQPSVLEYTMQTY